MDDRIAGAIVDLAYQTENNRKIAVEVLVEYGKYHVIIETTAVLERSVINAAIWCIAGYVKLDVVIVSQDEHLFANQADGIRCGDNGIFKVMLLTNEQHQFSGIA